MITTHEIQGSLDTTLHDFTVSIDNQDLVITGTHFTNNSEEKLTHDGSKVRITIDEPSNFVLWITQQGLTLVYKGGETPTDMLDRIAWGTLYDLHVVVMKNEG